LTLPSFFCPTIPPSGKTLAEVSSADFQLPVPVRMPFCHCGFLFLALTELAEQNVEKTVA
jgi:hypothetical protein